ncbi:hypothetical protein WJX72_007273 [[Myrmecia] bisecta]|uniref:STIL N-terminal domain-containing protein n=1 Tax=[Myrmecia] bisecta TaxID=41462 RepID=A0AAW1P026_9CHLO
MPGHNNTGLYTAAAFQPGPGCNQRGGLSLKQVMRLRVTVDTPAADNSPPQLQGLLMMPKADVRLTPLYAKRVCSVPLSGVLADTLKQPGGNPQDGFLSMDQARNVVPLLADDPQAYGVPVVGIWVAGVSSAAHPLVWAACVRFVASQQLADKAVLADQSFLLLLYAQGRPGQPSCYECRPRRGARERA